MLVYIITMALSLIFAYASDKSADSKRSVRFAVKKVKIKTGPTPIKVFDPALKNQNRMVGFCAFLSFLPLYVVSAVRYMVGTDYAGTYRSIYNYTYWGGWHFRLSGETLYGLLNKLASYYSGTDYVGVFALSSLVIVGFIVLGLREQSVNFAYSILLFVVSGYYFWSFNAVRQMAAMAIFLYAYRFVEERKPLKYCILIVVAAGFHTVALLYLPVYFIKKLKINLSMTVAAAAILFCFPVWFRKLAHDLASKIAVFDTYVTRYLESSRFSTYTESSMTHILINASFLGLYLVISFLYDKKRELSNPWINFQFIAFAFSALASILPLANRLSRLFAVMQILSVPFMTGLIPNARTRRFINMAIVISYSVYSFVTFYILGYHDIFPYQTIFSR